MVVRKILHTMMLNVHEVARLLTISDKKVYRLIAQETIPFSKVGDDFQFNRVELLEWATNHGISIATGAFEQSSLANPHASSFLDALRAGGIVYNVGGTDKPSVLKSVVAALRLPPDSDPAFLYQVLLAREQLGSTGIGDGIAIPHVRNPVILSVNKAILTLCFLENPIAFGAIDGLPVHTLFTLISPTIRVHLHLLSRIGFILQQPVFKTAIRKQAASEELFAAVAAAEAMLPVANNTTSAENA